jgi:hypothetical protein
MLLPDIAPRSARRAVFPEPRLLPKRFARETDSSAGTHFPRAAPDRGGAALLPAHSAPMEVEDFPSESMNWLEKFGVARSPSV